MILMDLEVLHKGSDVGHKLGSPVKFDHDPSKKVINNNDSKPSEEGIWIYGHACSSHSLKIIIYTVHIKCDHEKEYVSPQCKYEYKMSSIYLIVDILSIVLIIELKTFKFSIIGYCLKKY